MSRFLHRSLGLLVALALVVAGLPMAHAMPDGAMPAHEALRPHADMMAMDAADHAHHHVAMNDVLGSFRSDQTAPLAPCKCLNCSMCIASFVAAPVRLETLERRAIAVTYRRAVISGSALAIRVDPEIPILAA